MTQKALHISADDSDFEHWDDAVRGKVSWKTLVSSGQTPSKELSCGMAHFSAGGVLKRHSHQKAEVIHVIFGEGAGTVGDEQIHLSTGDTVFVPAGTAHEWVASDEGMGVFYVFASDSFEDVEYTFLNPETDKHLIQLVEQVTGRPA